MWPSFLIRFVPAFLRSMGKYSFSKIWKFTTISREKLNTGIRTLKIYRCITLYRTVEYTSYYYVTKHLEKNHYYSHLIANKTEVYNAEMIYNNMVIKFEIQNFYTISCCLPRKGE